MSQWFIRLLLLMGYTIPYIFLGMYEDDTYGTLWCYLITIIALAILCWLSARTQNIPIILLGNSLSYMTSYYCITHYQSDTWSWYFKPFSPIGLLQFVTILMIIIQLTFLLIYALTHRQK